MVYRNEIFSDELFDQRLSEGYVTERFNADKTLAIANYSDQAQYDWVWDDVTSNCRGLIYRTDTKEIVARPFPKFHNWDGPGVKYPPPGPVPRMPKMDGSLGILYPVYEEQFNGGNGGKFVTEYRIATRGSFMSDQATWATRKYEEMTDMYMHWTEIEDRVAGGAWSFYPAPGKTYLFEIIYPENRIVVNYGDQERLTLLDVIDNETGFRDVSEFESCEWPDKVGRVPMPGFDSGQVVDIPDGEEGFAYLWPTRNFRTKMKSAQYIELHRIISNLTPKRIWEQMVAGKDLKDIMQGIPDEFFSQVVGYYQIIEFEARKIFEEVNTHYLRLSQIASRKAYAAEVNKVAPHLRGLLFSMRDGKDIKPAVMRMVKPKADTN